MSQLVGPPLVHPVSGALETVTRGLDVGADAQLWQLCDGELVEAVAELHRRQCRAEALKLRLVREVDARGAGVAMGAPSTKAWLRSALRMHPGQAKRAVATAAASHADPAGPLVPITDTGTSTGTGTGSGTGTHGGIDGGTGGGGMDGAGASGGGAASSRGLAGSRVALAAGAISAEHVWVIAQALGAFRGARRCTGAPVPAGALAR